MIVVIASRYDEIARALVARWEAYDARLLTCEDLSVCGWRYYPSDSRLSTAVIGGQEVAQEKIRGVLTRLPSVYVEELFHIVPADRAYVAVEMTSFLVSWLSRLQCPVLNRPTPTCLSGPYWRQERWVCIAAQIGIPVRSVQRRIVRVSGNLPEEEEPKPSPVTVTIVGNRCFGAVDEALHIQARRIADAANVDLLAVQFSGPKAGSFFVGANLWPDVTADDVADAVLDYLQVGCTRGNFLFWRMYDFAVGPTRGYTADGST